MESVTSVRFYAESLKLELMKRREMGVLTTLWKCFTQKDSSNVCTRIGEAMA